MLRTERNWLAADSHNASALTELIPTAARPGRTEDREKPGSRVARFRNEPNWTSKLGLPEQNRRNEPNLRARWSPEGAGERQFPIYQMRALDDRRIQGKKQAAGFRSCIWNRRNEANFRTAPFDVVTCYEHATKFGRKRGIPGVPRPARANTTAPYRPEALGRSRAL